MHQQRKKYITEDITVHATNLDIVMTEPTMTAETAKAKAETDVTNDSKMSPSPTSKDEEDNAIVKKGLFVYFDNVEKTAKGDNDALKKYQRLHEQLTEICLYYDGNEIAVTNISDFNEEDEDWFIYDVTGATVNEGDIEVDQIYKFSCTVAGSEMESDNGGRTRPSYHLYFDDDSNLKLDFEESSGMFSRRTGGIRLIGTLTGYPGSIDDIQHIIDGNLHIMFFHFLGAIIDPANDPLGLEEGRNQVSALLGAVFQLEQLVVPKAEASHLLEVHSPELSEHAVELEHLAQAYSNYSGLRNAATITAVNEKLKATLDYYQTVRFSGESGQFLTMDLSRGSTHKLLVTRDGEIQSWKTKLPTDSIPLSSLKGLTVKLGGKTLYKARTHLFPSITHGPIHVPGGFLLKDDGFFKTEILFRYGENVDSFHKEEDSVDDFQLFLRRLERSITPTMSNVQYPADCTELEGMTVKPIFIQVRLNSIRRVLHELGIETTPENDL